MRCVMNGVDPGQGSRRMREVDDPPDIRDRADRIGSGWEGDDPGPVRQLSLEVVQVQRAVVADIHVADDEIMVTRQLEPGGDVGVMVEPGYENLVSSSELATQCSCQREVERGHVRPENDLFGAAAEE